MRSKIDKKQEAKLDLKRYYKLLPTLTEDKDDRDFFLRGIVNMDDITGRDWLVRFLRKKCPYTFTHVAEWCCVETKQVIALANNKDVKDKIWKKIYVGLQAFG